MYAGSPGPCAEVFYADLVKALHCDLLEFEPERVEDGTAEFRTAGLFQRIRRTFHLIDDAGNFAKLNASPLAG